MPLTTSQLLQNRYRIVKLIGLGGFGAVYRAWDTAVNQPVALKENLDTSAQAQRQFQREAAVMAGLRHPNLPRVTDHFLIPGQGQYLVMDFIEGKSLGEMLAARGRPFTEAEVLPWLEQVCEALHYLHTSTPPIIHRDIKPQNIIITPSGQASLVDFGISKIYDPSLATTVGAKAVTPGYSPPEQYGSGITDARTDVYALGATLYALLTNQEPPESIDLMIGNKTLTVPSQIDRQISSSIEQVILQAMNTTTSRRFQSVTDLKCALHKNFAPGPVSSAQVGPTTNPDPNQPVVKATTTSQSVTGRWNWLWVMAAVLVVVVVGGGLLLVNRGGGTTTAVTSAPETNAAMPIAENLRFMWEAGYKITDLTYANRQWAMIFSQVAPYGRQSWQLQNDPPAAYISQKWAEGYKVTSLAYGGQQWAVIMSRDTPFGHQTWQLQNETPADYMRQKWVEGYSVTSLAYAAGQWGIVMSQDAPYSQQTWQLQNKLPGNYIRQKWADGYRVTSLVYANGQWGIVMSQDAPYGRQKWQLQNEPPDSYIADMAAQGHVVTSLVYANGQWGIVTSQSDQVSRQVFRLMGK